MKKARVLLTSIAVFAVVGSALAYKVRTTDKIFCTTAGHEDVCTFQVNQKTISASQSGNLIRCSASSTTELCDETYTKAGL